MEWWVAIVLGIIQGATEFLPVSSSAHLALAPFVLGVPPPSFAFDVLVQLGTLGAVVLVLREDLSRIFASSMRGLWRRKPLIDAHAREGWLIVWATIPAVAFGLGFKDTIEEMFGDPREVLVELMLTGVLLAAAEVFRKRTEPPRAIDAKAALWIGVAQALAILPGVSRSGATIAMAIFLGIPRAAAGRFSFLMSVPVMLGAGVLSLKDLLKDPSLAAREGAPLALSFAVAAVVGFLVVRWFLDYLGRKALWGFAVYCIITSMVGLYIVSQYRSAAM